MNTRAAPGGRLPPDLQAAADLIQHGHFESAASLAQARLQERPNDGAALYLLGAISLQRGRFPEARRYLANAIASTKAASAQATCWNALGHALLGLNRPRRAQVAFRHALRLRPETPGFALDFAEAFIADGRQSSAAEVLNEVAAKAPHDPESRRRLGDLLMQCSRFNEALEVYKLAAREDPANAAALLDASTALLVLGQTEEARAACRRALELDPDLNAYYQLATLGGLEADTGHLATASKHATTDGGASTKGQIDACFALAYACDRKGDYDAAFDYLETGNRLKRSTLDFHMDAEAQRMDAIAGFFTAEFIARFGGRITSELQPIFILGMPRSGSSLLEQMLAAHPAITACGELDYMADTARNFGVHRGASVQAANGTDKKVVSGLRYAASLYERCIRNGLQCQGRFTDKMPANFLFVGLIHLMFPGACIIYMQRDPLDTCLSCYQHLFPGHAPFAYDLRELGEYFKLHAHLMRHWQSVLPKERLLTVHYESLVVEPEAQLRQILGYCGLEFDARCLKHHAVQRPVATLSAVQVREPVYHSSIGHWRCYEAHLGPLREALGNLE